jgi:hypothetical protein
MPRRFVGIAAAPVHPAFSDWIAMHEFCLPPDVSGLNAGGSGAFSD